jgi:hypothetical protein
MPYVLALAGLITGQATGTGMSSFAADNGL